jgi:small subunit ribosomal protein S4e
LKSESLICKLVGKTALKGGKIQLNLHGGKNIILSAKDAKKYSVGGSLIVSLPDFKIGEFIESGIGKMALVAKGRHSGKVGKIIEVTKSALNLKSLTTLDVNGEKLVTNTEYIFIVGDKESKI